MKLDGEQVFCHSTPGRKSDSKTQTVLADAKPSENGDNSPDSVGQEAREDIPKGNPKGFLSDAVGDLNPLPYVVNDKDSWRSPVLDSSMRKIDLAYDIEKEDGDFMTSSSHSSENMDSFEDSGFYMDKNLMESELPELEVCYKENTYHVVKDICIDEGAPAKDKFLFESRTDDESLHSFLSSAGDKSDELKKEKMDVETCIVEDSVSPEDSETIKGISNQCDLKSLTLMGERKEKATEREKMDAETCVPEDSVSLKENETIKGIPDHCDLKGLMLMGELKEEAVESQKMECTLEDSVFPEASETIAGILDPYQCDSKGLMPTEGMKEKSAERVMDDEFCTLADLLCMPELEGENTSSKLTRGINIEVELCQTASEKETSVRPTLVSSSGVLNSGTDETMPCPSPAPVSVAKESEGDINSINAAPAQAPASEESTSSSPAGDNAHVSEADNGGTTFEFDSSAPLGTNSEECNQNPEFEPLEARNPSRLEDTSAQPTSIQLQHGYGESSFSAVNGVSGLITYSGPIAYSGSLSLRSDSSTTSTRSFAFPILQSEWNSSPVRMAKADRRHYRKHRGWRHGILCCRF